ncbi:MAG: hypothetical protein ACR2MO_11130 [Acidimicrobiales bacterium]
MRHLAGAVVVAILALGAGCSGNQMRAGEAVVDIEPGSRVLIGERDQGLRAAEGRRTVHLGAQVKVLSGSAAIALGDGGRVDVRTGSEIEFGSPLSLVADDLLVTSGNTPLKVDVAGSVVTVDGVARLTRDLAVSAASYRGSLTVRSAARSLKVPALRQADVPSLGVLPAEAEPLRYDTADAWDRRYLAQAIDLGEQLESRGKGFTNQLPPGSGSTPGFYRVLLPALENEPAFVADLIPADGDPGDTLIGAAITVSGKLGTFAERWANVFRFRSAGATWGLVALDQQVNDADALVRTVDLAIGGQAFAFAPAPTVPSAVNQATPPPAAVPATPPPATPTRAPATPAAPPPAATPAAEPELITLPELPQLIPPPDPNAPGLLSPLLNVVTDTLSGLLSGD